MYKTSIAQVVIHSNQLTNSTNHGIEFGSILLIITFAIIILALIALTTWMLLRKVREFAYEKRSLSMKLLEVRVPQNNEVEVSAMEQLFASLYGLSKTKGIKKFTKAVDFISFEIIALPETI